MVLTLVFCYRSDTGLYPVEGSLKVPREGKSALTTARVLLNGGAYVGYVRSDGSFIM